MRALQKGPGGMGSGQAVVWANYPNMPGRSGGGLNGRPLGQEYDGLESGELAWILGRRFISSYATGPDAGGGGFGPDRMQRLAYTAWIEAFFHATFGKVVINLAQLQDRVNRVPHDRIEEFLIIRRNPTEHKLVQDAILAKEHVEV